MKRRDLFPSPLLLERGVGSPELRAELRERLVAEARATPGMDKSNVGGWHSQQDLFTRPDPVFRALTQQVTDGFRRGLALLTKPDPALQIGGISWAMVMDHGNYSTPHHHGEAHWAGVYYVDVGDQPADAHARAGCLTFLDPRGPRQAEDDANTLQTSQDLRPEDGLLVFFPGWLMHHVHPYVGTRPRVSVSFNLQVVRGVS